MDDQGTFPKYQVSGFVGGRNGKQYVFRSNSAEEFKSLDKELDILLQDDIELPKQPTPDEDILNGAGHYCGTCGEKQEYRSGFKKDGKTVWEGWFCTKDSNHPPRWGRI